MDFITKLLISTDWKNENHNSILVIIDQLTKIVYYKLLKITINTLRMAKVILDVVVWYHDFFNIIVSNRGLFFISKF